MGFSITQQNFANSMDGSADIGAPHVAEAIQFRSLDRQDRLVA